MSLEARRKQLMETDPEYMRVANIVPPNYGELPSMPVGTKFKDRYDCYLRGMHGHNVRGIVGDLVNGAQSIVLSDGYEDDVDNGDKILYTGAGGQANPYGKSGAQIHDQTFEERSNVVMEASVRRGLPVRVIRGWKGSSLYSPTVGFRYDGLYKVVKSKTTSGKNGHQICQFELERVKGQRPLPTD